MKAGPGVIDIADDRLVEDVALRRFDAHRADQHQPMKVARRQRRHFGSDPAAIAEPDEAGALDPEIGKQPLIERGDIARMAQPLRPFGDAEAGVVRHDHIEFFGERIIERQTVERANIVMQDQHRSAASAPRTAAHHPELYIAQFGCLLVPPNRHNPSLYSPILSSA